MTKFVFLCLVLVSGTVALAQQPAEWRPNIAEDNKAATWDQTASFIVGTLNNLSSAAMYAAADERCILSLNGSRTILNSLYPFGIKPGAALWPSSGTPIQGVPIADISPNSFGDYLRLKSGMIIVAVNGLPVNGEPDLEKAWDSLQFGEKIFFEVRRGNSPSMTPITFKGRLISDHGTAAIITSKASVKLNLAKVDPLGIYVLASDLHITATNNEPPARFVLDNGEEQLFREPLVFPMSDTEIAKRLARALMHAALLCGSSKAVSPF